MSDYESLNIKIDQRGVVYVELNRPEKKNALSATMISELTDMALTIGSDSNTRAVVLSGSGNIFCAGGDLGWMHDQISANRDQRMTEARKLATMLNTLNEMPTPLIGKIHGGAFGGGVGMACVCDVVVASENTKFGFTETKLGLIPATIGPYIVARIGEGMARRMFMSARIFMADEAHKLGIVSEVVSDDELDEAIEREIKPYLSVAPQAVGASKSLLRFLGNKIDPSVIDETITRLANTWEGEEAKLGIEAFLSKTSAPWAMKK